MTTGTSTQLDGTLWATVHDVVDRWGARHRMANSSPASRASMSPRIEQGRHPVAELDEQRVAGVVTERVVDLLEAIEVHHHHPAHAPAAARQGVGDRFLEEASARADR